MEAGTLGRQILVVDSTPGMSVCNLFKAQSKASEERKVPSKKTELIRLEKRSDRESVLQVAQSEVCSRTAAYLSLGVSLTLASLIATF
jgi:hypothetical protein